MALDLEGRETGYPARYGETRRSQRSFEECKVEPNGCRVAFGRPTAAPGYFLEALDPASSIGSNLNSAAVSESSCSTSATHRPRLGATRSAVWL
jgi:hypothetical protein